LTGQTRLVILGGVLGTSPLVRLATVVLLAAAAAGCTAPGTPSPPPPAAGCGEVSAGLVPSCGAWFGMYARTDASYGWNPTVPLVEIEDQVGRQFDIVHSYRDMSNAGRNGAFPDSYDRQQAADGRLLLIGWESRIFSSGTTLTWRQIYEGGYDAAIDAAGARLADFGEPIFVAFDHEPEDEPAKGSDADYVRAYRHVVDRVRAAGADNVIWVWNMMGWSGHYSRYDDLYPGDDYVDWVGYDPYNFFACNGNPTWKTPYDTVHGFYQWLDDNGIGAGKPRMLAEYGTNFDTRDAGAKQAWFEAFPAAVEAHPQIKAVVYFNSAGSTSTSPNCNMTMNHDAAAVAGFSAAGADPYFNQPR
jgi:hypothetical protein